MAPVGGVCDQAGNVNECGAICNDRPAPGAFTGSQRSGTGHKCQSNLITPDAPIGQIIDLLFVNQPSFQELECLFDIIKSARFAPGSLEETLRPFELTWQDRYGTLHVVMERSCWLIGRSTTGKFVFAPEIDVSLIAIKDEILSERLKIDPMVSANGNEFVRGRSVVLNRIHCVCPQDSK
jgi:hypothetical protein